MATVRMAAGNLLGTVADTANAISVTANTISGGVEILNDMVNTIKNKRRESTLVEMKDYRKVLKEQASLNAVKREQEIRSYIGTDEEKAKSYNNYMSELDKMFEEYDRKNSEPEE